MFCFPVSLVSCLKKGRRVPTLHSTRNLSKMTHLCLLPLADEGDDLLADLRLFYCDTATFGESAANVQQVRRV